jgi:hypothetical protein
MMVGPVDRSTVEEPVASTDEPDNPVEWLADGTLIISTEGARSGDLFALNVDDDDPPRPLLDANWQERGASLSPDGRWLAYTSRRSGASQLYVRSWPDLEGEILVSEGAADVARQSYPQWSADGATLYYQKRNQIFAASVRTEDGFEVLSTPILPFEANGWLQDIHPDGRLPIPVFDAAPQDDQSDGTPQRLIVSTGWFTELMARLGGGN